MVTTMEVAEVKKRPTSQGGSRDMPTEAFQVLNLSLDDISPSPFQTRKSFNEERLADLGESLSRDGVIEPVVVRLNGDGYELIAGERRWRAAQKVGIGTLPARVVKATDLEARRMMAAENLQREDLSPIEEAESIVELIDAQLVEDEEYASMGEDSVSRVEKLLGKLHAVKVSEKRGSKLAVEANDLFNKFVKQVKHIFDTLPKPTDWRSFYNHDLKLVTDLDDYVREVAVREKLNKSQTKELNKVAKQVPEYVRTLTEESSNTASPEPNNEPSQNPSPKLKELSAREIKSAARGYQKKKARDERKNGNGENHSLPETCSVKDLNRLIEVGAEFGTIYADPPWQYDNQSTRAATEDHYSGMTVEEIAELPIEEIVADDAHLHLWTTNAFLPRAFEVMKAWGFEYKSCFVWVKPQMGIGNYWRVSHEFLLFGKRGDAPFESRGYKSWREIDRTRHSEKPEEIRSIIEDVSPGPYLELFGRRIVNNWVVWGNEIERTMFDQDVKELA